MRNARRDVTICSTVTQRQHAQVGFCCQVTCRAVPSLQNIQGFHITNLIVCNASFTHPVIALLNNVECGS
jgi:hypothetical protein